MDWKRYDFKYLGALVKENRGIDVEMKHGVNAAHGVV